jgi:hypothetical protein
MRTTRAASIGNILSDTKRWNSHGRGISMEILRRDVRLQIQDLQDDDPGYQLVRRYYRLLKDFMGVLGHTAVLHFDNRFVPLMGMRQ